MIFVHPNDIQRHIDSGYALVDDPEHRGRTCMVSRKRTCLREMRTGRCLMDEGHRGRCSTAVFYCETCGKARRGQPYRTEQVRLGDGSIDDEFSFCFMCARVDRDAYRYDPRHC